MQGFGPWNSARDCQPQFCSTAQLGTEGVLQLDMEDFFFLCSHLHLNLHLLKKSFSLVSQRNEEN